jgi:hypothetical protein
MIIFLFYFIDVDMSSVPFIYTIYLTFFANLPGETFIHSHSYYLPILCLFRFLFHCFGSIETPKHAVSILNRNNRNKRLVSDSVETSFGSIFGCFESKLVS